MAIPSGRTGNCSDRDNLRVARGTWSGSILVEISLTGTIPAALGDLARLERVYLAQNQLTGCIPGVERVAIHGVT